MSLPHEPAPASPDVLAVPTRPARFTGDGRAYWRLLIRGGVLLAVTLGIYRFWFATEVRRFLWSNSEVEGESFEYTGTAVELLLGFLIAIALLVPFYVLFFVITLNMGPAGEAASTLGFVILAFLGQYAIYRARRYRLTRTVFRGVRFHQTGSALRYAICAVFWWVMIFLTLGLAYPFSLSRLERFKLRNTYYGDLKGRFEGSGWRLLLRGLPMWILVMAPIVFALGILGTVDWARVEAAAGNASGAAELFARVERAVPGFYLAVISVIGALVISIAMALVLFPAFQAMTLRWWASGVRFGGLTLRSRLRTGVIYLAYGRLLLYALAFLIVVSVIAATGIGIFYAIFAGATGTQTEFAGTIGAVVLYVFVMLGFSTIYQGTAKLTLWRHGVDTLELEGLKVLDGVKAGGAPGSAVGEGLADALNVGGI